MSAFFDSIVQGLDKAYGVCPADDVELRALKMIVFSDHHRGQRDGADDFHRCRSAYNSALAYYHALGFTLTLLGDVEELWECRPGPVLRACEDTLLIEKRFTDAGRYYRVCGNHDDYWEKPSAVERCLRPFIGSSEVLPAIRLRILNNGRQLGELFLTHGHQGTTESDRYALVSKFMVRNVWRNIQRLTRIPSTTSAKDFKLRQQHELAMHRWAAAHPKLVMIAGHTHHPVFSSKSHEELVKAQIDELRGMLRDDIPGERRAEIEVNIAELSAAREWILAASDGVASAFDEIAKPCYFNAGCCSFADGDVTGIEIEGNIMRLVRWPDDTGSPKRKILAEADLVKVFDDC